jgi:hypothetical protein
MKTIVVVLLALAPAVAQIRPVGVGQPAPAPAAEAARVSAPVPVMPAIRPARITLGSLNVLQSGFDNDLGSYDINDPVDILGKTRGVYLNDYGVVFTTELSPIVTPGISPFHQTITAEEKARTHQRKLQRLPTVIGLMGKMMKTTAAQLAVLPDNQQLVLVVKLLYLPYEDTTGLPGQIVMKGDKRSVLAGRFTTETE